MNKKAAADTKEQEKDNYSIHPINIAISNLFNATWDFRQATHTTLPYIAKKLLNDIKKAEKKLSKYQDSMDDNGDLVIAEAHEVKELIDIHRELEELTSSKILSSIPRSFFIGLFSSFDSFIGDLLKALYKKNLSY